MVIGVKFYWFGLGFSCVKLVKFVDKFSFIFYYVCWVSLYFVKFFIRVREVEE